MALHVRGTLLPDGEPGEFWVDGDRLTRRPVPGAETVADGGWLLPGLVDAHTHPGLTAPETTPAADALAADGARHLDAGVTLIRVPGLPQPPPPSLTGSAGFPRTVWCGHRLMLDTMWDDPGARHVRAADLPEAAVAEVDAADGWCKVYADTTVDDSTMDLPILPAGLLAETVAAVHAAGGRVAVHAMRADACAAAVEAGVDSLEHGLHLDPALLERMAAQGTALVPTFTVWAGFLEMVRAEPPGRFRDWFLSGWEHLPALVRAAHEAGVTVLAGTDLPPCGRIAGEVAHLAAAGLPPEVALGAACWTARRYLGAPDRLDEGAPADLVVFPADPREDLGVLETPARVISRGRIVDGTVEMNASSAGLARSRTVLS